MTRYGLIGKTLTHSFSKNYFTDKFADMGLKDHQYDLIELDCIDQIQYWMMDNGDDVVGLNVTIPYKEAILPYIDHISSAAQDIGAVNTIHIKDGEWYGYNTDEYGFRQSLIDHADTKTINRALILGTGGASKSVAYALRQLDICYIKVSRTPEPGQLNYKDIDVPSLQSFNLIINTTPIGTYPNIDYAPELPYDGLLNSQILYDLVYNPNESLFLKRGMEQGCSVLNGLPMLHYQAEQAWNIWTTTE